MLSLSLTRAGNNNNSSNLCAVFLVTSEVELVYCAALDFLEITVSIGLEISGPSKIDNMILVGLTTFSRFLTALARYRGCDTTSGP